MVVFFFGIFFGVIAIIWSANLCGAATLRRGGDYGQTTSDDSPPLLAGPCSGSRRKK